MFSSGIYHQYMNILLQAVRKRCKIKIARDYIDTLSKAKEKLYICKCTIVHKWCRHFFIVDARIKKYYTYSEVKDTCN